MSKNFKDYSRENWVSPTGNASDNQIQIGCLQRIADATELMAQNHRQLIQERDRYEKWYYEERAKREALERSIRTHKANYTRLKNKYESEKAL